MFVKIFSFICKLILNFLKNNFKSSILKINIMFDNKIENPLYMICLQAHNI